jgi:mRNA interferase MazF
MGHENNRKELQPRKASPIGAKPFRIGPTGVPDPRDEGVSMDSLRLQRGDVVTVASSCAYSGQPRPALVVQANQWLDGHPSITLSPITSTLIDANLVRIHLEPSSTNGLRKPLQVMVDKLFTVPVGAIGKRIGQLDATSIARVDQALRHWLQFP